MDSDFLIGDWIVRSNRNTIEKDDSVRHLAPKAMAVLRCLARASGSVVTRKELFAAVWPGGAVTDDALTQRIVEIRKAFGDDARDPAVVQTVPKTGFRLVAPVSPLRTETRNLPNPQANESAPTSGISPGFFLVAVVAVLFVAAAAWRFTGIGGEQTGLATTAGGLVDPSAAIRSILVLPFDDLTDGYVAPDFLEAINSEIVVRLAQVPSLVVISNDSTDQYPDSELTPLEMARELSAASVLTGAVRQLNGTLRLHVQLLDAEIDEYVWADSFTDDLTSKRDVAVRSEIAQRVSGGLLNALSPEQLAQLTEYPTENFKAYEALLEGHIALRRSTRGSFAEAIGLYQRAIDLDPGSPQAYLAMARAYTKAGEEFGTPESQATERIETYARTVIRLDPQVGLAYHYLAQVQMETGRLDHAEVLSRQAAALEPGNPLILHGLGLVLRLQGRAPEAIPYYDRAARVAPTSPIILESRGSLLRDLGRFDEAEKQYLATLEVDPDFANAHWGLGTLYWSMGWPDKAIPWFENAARLAPNSDVYPAWLALMRLELQQDEQARVILDGTLQHVPGDADNDAVLAEELYRIYHGAEVTGLADGRRFMYRYWHGAVVDLPVRALLDGRYAAAVAVYEEAFPGISSGDLLIDGSNYRAAIYVAFALEKLGESAAAATLLNAVDDVLVGMRRLGIHGFWISDVQILVIRGNYTEALNRLGSAIDEGWRNLWRFYLFHDPVLAELYGDSRYQKLVDRFIARSAPALAKAL